MIFTVERGGTAEQVDIDLAFDYFTPPETERAAAALGQEAMREVVAAWRGDPSAITNPLETLRVLTWAKLATYFPDLPLDGFTLEPPTEVDPAGIPVQVLDG